MPLGVNNEVNAFQKGVNTLIQEENLKDTFLGICVPGKNQEHNQNDQKFLATIASKELTLNEEETVSPFLPLINIAGYLVGNGIITTDPKRL